MALNPLIDFDFSFADFVARTNELLPQGFRLLSLSMYGDPFDARFSAVWDKRSGPDWGFSYGFTVPDVVADAATNKAAGLFPALVTATGGGASTRMSVIYERLDPPKTRELTVDQDLAAFAGEVLARAKNGWMIRSATIYDDAASQPRVAAVWAKNSGNVAWTAFAGIDAGRGQQIFSAESASWARVSFITASTQGRFLAVYRDDQIGPIGTGFIVRQDRTLEQFLSEQASLLGTGFYTICFQGYGLGSARRFAAIFVSGEKLVERTVQKTGGPVVPVIDDAVLALMNRSNIRGAALAIVKGTRLVLARGYTWAEPDYPTVQPTTCFRLGSGSKLTTALGIHQLVAEGLVKLTDQVSAVLPLTPPPGMTAVNARYLNGTVAQLLEENTIRMPRYEGEGANIKAAFKTTFPVKQSQIASFMITKPVVTDAARLDDCGYFLAGQIVKKLRGTSADKSLMEAVGPRLTTPLQITRVHAARSLVSTQPAGEARYHSRDLELHDTVMDESKTLVPREYGDEHLETMEGSGGLSAAVTDYARLLAAMNARPYTPIGRPVVDQLLKSAEAVNGHGFDFVDPLDAPHGLYQGAKGGLLQSTQAGVWYSGAGISYVIVWNGLHTGNGLRDLDPTIGPEWYPTFTKVVEAANTHAWPATDLFPEYQMESLAATQDNWRWCEKCQGLFFAGIGLGVCPAGGAHVKTGSGNYALMHDSKLGYGQGSWRWCKACQGLFHAGPPGKCPAGGGHDKSASGEYRLLLNSPYAEHQQHWRFCKKCQGLFFEGKKASVCPAGGAHDMSGSGNYSLASS